MTSTFGKNLIVSITGESHGDEISAVAAGLPVGERVDMSELSAFLERRRGGGRYTTARSETDIPMFTSGLRDGVTDGSPLTVVIKNTDARAADYAGLSTVPRPSHADFTAWKRGGSIPPGGGHFSGRLTAPLCAVGGAVLQILRRRGVTVGAHLYSVGEARDVPFSMIPEAEDLLAPGRKAFPAVSGEAGEAMAAAILAAREEGDSVGGIVECGVAGLPAGIGEPLFGGVENRLSSALFGLGGLRGVEFGAGFSAARMRGSTHNDPFGMVEGRPQPLKNDAGGLLGGMTTGLPLIFRAAFKPTPSISLPQRTVDLAELREVTLELRGRHDPCIALRAVPCVEAVCAITLMDILLDK